MYHKRGGCGSDIELIIFFPFVYSHAKEWYNNFGNWFLLLV